MKKSVKITLIVISVLIVVAILVGGYIFTKDIAQKNKLMDELAKMESITSDVNFEKSKLEERTNIIVAEGKYAIVEKAFKNYISDVYDTAYEVRDLLEDEKMTKLLTPENLKNDGPEFTETKQYLTNTKKQLTEKKESMISYLKEDKINSYIEAETKDSYCINLYKELITDDIKTLEQEGNELNASMDTVMNLLNNVEETIDFLIANKGKWQIQGEQVMFNSNELVQTYNNLISKLQ